jgi:hypothetical protein
VVLLFPAVAGTELSLLALPGDIITHVKRFTDPIFMSACRSLLKLEKIDLHYLTLALIRRFSKQLQSKEEMPSCVTR